MTTNRTYTTVQELIAACTAYFQNHYEHANQDQALEKNLKLAQFIEKFHEEAGTLTSTVTEQINSLYSKRPIIIMTAHQPNLFAYSGVFRKATLLHVLQQKLQERLSVPIIAFFGIADQDFTDDRWIKTAQLPSVQQRNGVLNLLLQLPPKQMVKAVSKPSIEVLGEWKQQIDQWISIGNHLNLDSLLTQSTQHRVDRRTLIQLLRERFDVLWKIVLIAHERSTTHADFNAFVMSQIINTSWSYPTLFSRFSECQQIFTKEFAFLCQQHEIYHQALHKVRNQAPQIKKNYAVPLAPFWYHCECGGKARLLLKQQNTSLRAEGKCINCTKHHSIDLGSAPQLKLHDIRSRISARAIPMALIFFNGLELIGYVGGVGGRRYLFEAQQISTALELPFPPVTDWRPRDKYLGIGQLEALLERKRILEQYKESTLADAKRQIHATINNKNREITLYDQKKQAFITKMRTEPQQKNEMLAAIKDIATRSTRLKRESNLLNLELTIINNISQIDALYPSIIDYAINIGLPETSKQWIDHLVQNQKLTSDVHMKTLWEY